MFVMKSLIVLFASDGHINGLLMWSNSHSLIDMHLYVSVASIL